MINPQNPKDVLGSTKPGLSTIPCAPLYEVAAALLTGAMKYGKHNWRAVPVRASVYYDASLRHIMAWWEGQDNDPESGLPHLAHAVAGLLLYRDASINNMVIDDRPIATGNPHIRIAAQVKALHDACSDPAAPFTQQNWCAQSGDTDVWPQSQYWETFTTYA